MIRVGQGFDVHAFAENRKLILGGVEVPYFQGLLGYSDADVIIHALCDAMLGALALGDIGQYFPDSDLAYRGIDSRQLLRYTNKLIAEKTYCVHNADITVLAQVPKLAPYLFKMRENLATDLKISVDDISIKATTTERLGFVGREEGIATYAIVSLTRDS